MNDLKINEMNFPFDDRVVVNRNLNNSTSLNRINYEEHHMNDMLLKHYEFMEKLNTKGGKSK